MKRNRLPISAGDQYYAARSRFFTFPELGGMVTRTALGVMGLPEGDPRRPYAQEYVALLLEFVEHREEFHEFAGTVAGLEMVRSANCVRLADAHGFASAALLERYGCSLGDSSAASERAVYDPAIARLALQGIKAAEGILAEQVQAPS